MITGPPYPFRIIGLWFLPLKIPFPSDSGRTLPLRGLWVSAPVHWFPSCRLNLKWLQQGRSLVSYWGVVLSRGLSESLPTLRVFQCYLLWNKWEIRIYKDVWVNIQRYRRLLWEIVKWVLLEKLEVGLMKGKTPLVQLYKNDFQKFVDFWIIYIYINIKTTNMRGKKAKPS